MLSKLNKTIEYGLYLLVFLLPLQTRWIIRGGASEYSTISFFSIDTLLFIIILLFAILKFKIQNYKFQINSKLQIQNLIIFIIGLDLVIFISIFFASDKLIAIQFYLRFLLGIGLFWILTKANYNKTKLIYSFLAGIFLQACLGIWQFLTQSTFSSKWLGIASHNSCDLGVSVIETISGERWLRAYGGLDHPNVLGGLLVIGVLLLIINKIFQPKADPPRAGNIQYPIFLIALFFTFSRSSWLALIIGLLSIFIIAIIKKDLFAQKKILQIILVSSIFIFILFNIFQDLVLTRFSNNTRLENKSNIERIDSSKESLDIIKDNWLFGVGAGNYVEKIKIDKYSQPVHNVFLLVFVEIGIFGLIFFVSLLLFAVNSRNIFLLIALFTIFMFDHYFWSLHFGILLFWLILGVMLKFDSEKIVDYN